MTTIAALVRELESEALTTRRVLERVDETQMDWRPHEKSLSLGQLAMHVATLPGALAEISTRPTFEVGQPIPRPSAANTAELLATLERSVAEARQLLTEMGDEGLSATWRMVSHGTEVGAIPREAFLRSVLFNHWYHHRGQLTVYLRMTGALVPSIYGPSADEAPGA